LNSKTAKIIARTFFSFSLLFGFYLMAHGHISHGAGFAGGVLITLAFLQVVIVLGKDAVSGIINRHNAKLVAVLGTGALLLIAALGYFYGNSFLSNYISTGTPFTIFSGGTAALFNIALCTGTAGCLVLIYLSIFKKG